MTYRHRQALKGIAIVVAIVLPAIIGLFALAWIQTDKEVRVEHGCVVEYSINKWDASVNHIVGRVCP